jgi:hypothetical protein
MYKFFALLFFTFPILFIGLYTLYSESFFDDLFIYFLLIGAVSYVAFVMYFIVQTFMDVRTDSFFNSIVKKTIKYIHLGFLKVTHITNAIAFIWVTLLFSLMLALFLWLIAYFCMKLYGMQIIGLVSYVSEYSTRDAQVEADLRTVNKNVDFLIQAHEAEKSGEFFANNRNQYTDTYENYEYLLTYKKDVSSGVSIDPTYKYNIRVCRSFQSDSVCTHVNYSPETNANFLLSQNEVIKDLQGEHYEFSEDIGGETLHRVRLTTNLRTMDIMLSVTANISTIANYTSQSPSKSSSYYYEYLGENAGVKSFEYSEFEDGKDAFRRTSYFRYYPDNGGIVQSTFFNNN